jgi:hypothetical protein
VVSPKFFSSRHLNPYMKCHWNRTMLNLYGIVTAILKMATARNFSMSRIYSGHHNLPTYEMSLKSDNVELWCPEYIPDIEKFLAVAIFKMAAKIQHCPISSRFDMWVDNDVPNWLVAILKMATARNFSMSGIYSGHHNLPTYEMSLKSNNVEFVRYCGGHFENGYVGRLWCPE